MNHPGNTTGKLVFSVILNIGKPGSLEKHCLIPLTMMPLHSYCWILSNTVFQARKEKFNDSKFLLRFERKMFSRELQTKFCYNRTSYPISKSDFRGAVMNDIQYTSCPYIINMQWLDRVIFPEDILMQLLRFLLSHYFFRFPF